MTGSSWSWWKCVLHELSLNVQYLFTLPNLKQGMLLIRPNINEDGTVANHTRGVKTAMSESRDMRPMLEVEERLRKAASKLEYKKKLQRKLEHAKATLELEKSRLTNLEEFLAKEEKDVKQLEGLSLTNLFHTILGTKDEAFEKERQEYLAALNLNTTKQKPQFKLWKTMFQPSRENSTPWEIPTQTTMPL